MFNKNSNNNNNNNNKNNTNNENKMGDFEHLINKKIEFFKDIIQKTLLYVQKNKTFDILGISDVVMCLDKLTDLNNKMNEMNQMNQMGQMGLMNHMNQMNNNNINTTQ